MNHVMLDLETMGTRTNAAIVAIGAAAFDDTGILDTFYQVVNLESSVALGMVIEPQTVLWWLKQEDPARKELYSKQGENLTTALAQFAEWLPQNSAVWGNGASFDNAILSNAYKLADMEQPWSYRDDRCYRTIKAMNPGIKLERTGTLHNALDDAISQALHLGEIWRELEEQRSSFSGA